MIKRKTLRTRNIKTLVLDEADELLNKGFKEQIYDIYRFLPPATQVLFNLTLFLLQFFLVLFISLGDFNICYIATCNIRNDK